MPSAFPAARCWRWSMHSGAPASASSLPGMRTRPVSWPRGSGTSRARCPFWWRRWGRASATPSPQSPMPSRTGCRSSSSQAASIRRSPRATPTRSSTIRRCFARWSRRASAPRRAPRRWSSTRRSPSPAPAGRAPFISTCPSPSPRRPPRRFRRRRPHRRRPACPPISTAQWHCSPARAARSSSPGSTSSTRTPPAPLPG